MEIYKDIEGYEQLYQISNYGNVKSLKYNKEKILKPAKLKNGYLQVTLCKEEKRKQHYIHRLVGEAFIDNPNNYKQVNHKDENPANNNVSNLEWCTNEYNINYGTRTEKTSKKVMCIETGVVYPSASEVQRQLGFAQTNISSVCNGIRNTCGGFHWSFLDQEIGYN